MSSTGPGPINNREEPYNNRAEPSQQQGGAKATTGRSHATTGRSRANNKAELSQQQGGGCKASVKTVAQVGRTSEVHKRGKRFQHLMYFPAGEVPPCNLPADGMRVWSRDACTRVIMMSRQMWQLRLTREPLVTYAYHTGP